MFWCLFTPGRADTHQKKQTYVIFLLTSRWYFPISRKSAAATNLDDYLFTAYIMDKDGVNMEQKYSPGLWE